MTSLAPADYPVAAPAQPIIDWAGFEPFSSHFLGVSAFDASDADWVRNYLDWNALFRKWELPVRFPDVLDDANWGGAARNLFGDANALLNDWLVEGKLRADVVFGVWRASAGGDQVVVRPEARTPEACMPEARTPEARTPIRLSFPRLPVAAGGSASAYLTDDPTYCAADFIKPTAALKTGESDYLGGYAIRLAEELRVLLGQLAAGQDGYRALLAADLVALYRSAVVDYLHYRLRRFIWAYCDDDDLSNQEVLTGMHQGIRVDIGGPECPNQAEQVKLLNLLGVDNWETNNPAEGTDSPFSLLSGYFFGHPRSRNAPAV